MRLTPILFVAGLLLSRPNAQAQKFYPDDPIQRDNDSLDTPEKPASIELGDLYDRVSHITKDFGSSEIGSEARNVNTLDEVPDSNWFTNRHGANRMSLEDLGRGSNVGGAPNPHETWTVFKGKSQGLTPGFEILDSKGDRYVIKLDPLGVPELSTAAEAIATKIFYAIGYNTPANYIVRFHPDNFAIQEGTQVEDSFGDEQPLTEWRLRRMIRRVPRAEDGTIRVTASKYISGRPTGPFRYYETRLRARALATGSSGSCSFRTCSSTRPSSSDPVSRSRLVCRSSADISAFPGRRTGRYGPFSTDSIIIV